MREISCRVFLASLLEADHLALVKQGLEYIQFADLLPSGARVFLKPNLTYPVYRPGVMTSPQMIEAAILAIREYTPHIAIGDADSGGYNRFSMEQVYEETGLRQMAAKYDVRVVNLSRVERKAVHFKYQNRNFTLSLPRLLTDEMDLLVTIPVPKVHANTGVSLTFKNQWGCIPEPTDRLRLHPYFKHVILEVNKAVKARVAIIDGKYGLNVNGPMKGHPVELNWMIVTNNIGAGARVACELMQIPLETVEHLRYAEKLGFIPDLEDIEMNRDLHSFIGQEFFIRREWTDYPGFLAFRSSFLAYLAYFSPIADLLHRILYLVREPFYNYDKYSRRR